MTTTSFLHAIRRRPSVIAALIAQVPAACLLLADRPIPAAAVAVFSIAWLVFLLAAADDRATLIRINLDAARARVAELETELAEANTDPVTGLPVRRLAEQHITNAVGELTVAVADVDDMHGINNSHNHQFGDDYLAGIAQRLRQLTQAGDMVARLGGDEFVIVTTRGPQAVERVLTTAMREPITVNQAQIPIRLTAGICQIAGGDTHGGLGRADLAMYTAKRRRSGIAHYDAARDGLPQPPGIRPAVRHRDRRDTTGHTAAGHRATPGRRAENPR